MFPLCLSAAEGKMNVGRRVGCQTTDAWSAMVGAYLDAGYMVGGGFMNGLVFG